MPGHKGLIIILHCMATIQPHCKKRSTIFPFPAGMLLTKHSLAGNNLVNLIIPGQGEFGYSDIPAGDGKIGNLFYSAVTAHTNSTLILYA
jgi:hypothetical protein